MKRYLIYFSLFIIIFSSCADKSKDVPVAEKGFLNCSTYCLEENQSIALNGEWEFYWNQLISPNGFSTNQNIDYFKIPSLWNNYEYNNLKLTGNGFATFRLKVKLPEHTKTLAFRFNRIETAYKFWINNELISEIGTVGQSAEQMQAKWLPKDYIYDVKSDTLDIVLQVSNFKHRKGGIAHEIIMGKPDKIMRITDVILAFDIFLLGVLLIMAFYHFGLYFLRKKDPSTLFFGIACVATGIYTTVNGEFLLTRIFNDANWELIVKTNFISNYGRITFFSLFLGTLFKKEINPKIIKATVIWAAAMSLLTIITPARIYTHTLMILIIGSLLIIIYLIIGLIRASFNKRDGALYSIIGTIILFGTAINDTLYDFGIINTLYLITFGIFIFIFFQSFMLALRSSKSFTNVEKLTDQLLILDEIKNELMSISSFDLGETLKVIIKHVNATKGVLIAANEKDTLFVEAEAYINQEKAKIFHNFTADPENNQKLLNLFSVNLFKDSLKSNQELIINSVNSSKYKDNYYFKNRNVKSCMFFPIIEKQNLKGIIYLENTNNENAYSEKQLKIMDLLSSQIATIIDNAHIYYELEGLNRHLEEIVEQRTAEVYQQKEEIEAQRDEIEQKNKYLNKAYDEIERKNRDMTDSIRYAKRIQESILPQSGILTKVFPESFILFKPRDILSGDFYWFDHIYSSNFPGDAKTEKFMVAAVDCTGHGVPGALMSLIGNNLINYAVNELKNTRPADILNILQRGLRAKLNQVEKKDAAADGMDLSFISYEVETKKLQFSGAKNSIFILRDDEVIVLKGDKYGIGDVLHLKNGNDIAYTNIEFQLKSGDAIYLFSDGYVDQFGGPKGRKLMSPKFKEILISIQNMEMQQQREVLNEFAADWKGQLNQIDDILIIGLKII